LYPFTALRMRVSISAIGSLSIASPVLPFWNPA
jgi:hypothetical protein